MLCNLDLDFLLSVDCAHAYFVQLQTGQLNLNYLFMTQTHIVFFGFAATVQIIKKYPPSNNGY